MLDIERAVLRAFDDPASAGDPEADRTGLDEATAPKATKVPDSPPLLSPMSPVTSPVRVETHGDPGPDARDADRPKSGPNEAYLTLRKPNSTPSTAADTDPNEVYQHVRDHFGEEAEAILLVLYERAIRARLRDRSSAASSRPIPSPPRGLSEAARRDAWGWRWKATALQRRGLAWPYAEPRTVTRILEHAGIPERAGIPGKDQAAEKRTRTTTSRSIHTRRRAATGA